MDDPPTPALPAFSFASAPFDALTPAERTLLLGSVEPARFAPGEVLLAADADVSHAWLLVQGHVQLFDAGEVIAIDGPGDLCAARAALGGRASGLLRALDEVQAWQIPRPTLQTLIAGNPAFSAWVFGGISHRLADASRRQPRREFVSLMAAHVRDAGMRKPFYVDGGLDLVSTCRLMAQQSLRHALVRDGARVGMFTTTDLRDALLLTARPDELAVREVARFDLIAVAPDAQVFEALQLMLRHRVHRVLVRDGEAIVGVLSQLDLMGFVSTHSHLIALQIEQATSVAELKQAALQMDALVVLLHNDGIRVELISSIVHDLNRKLLARLWAILAPADLVANSCLLVMGSEGRGEQILKTDQDNALLLRDGFPTAGVQQVTAVFSAALIEFGYPPCPGNIMVSNPLWCQPVSAFKQSLRHWMFGADPNGVMHLAIFLDALAVAGDPALLEEARSFIDKGLVGNDVFFARFVSAADQFSEPVGWWTRLVALRGGDEPAFDLKKLGTFPVVHGVRTLALQHHVAELGTTARLRALVDRKHLPAQMARDLTEALHFLMALKLDNSLRQRRSGQAADNLVRLSTLGTLERELMKDSLAIIRGFRQHLRELYRLELL
jgi:CBS domain-containing protein